MAMLSRDWDELYEIIHNNLTIDSDEIEWLYESSMQMAIDKITEEHADCGIIMSTIHKRYWNDQKSLGSPGRHDDLEDFEEDDEN